MPFQWRRTAHSASTPGSCNFSRVFLFTVGPTVIPAGRPLRSYAMTALVYYSGISPIQYVPLTFSPPDSVNPRRRRH